MHSRLRTVAARHALGVAEMDEMIDAAHAALDAGIHSYALGELASQFKPNSGDSERLFMAAKQELGINVPDDTGCMDILFQDTWTQIVEGTSPTIEVLNRILLDSDSLPHNEQLQLWASRCWQVGEIDALHQAGWGNDLIAEKGKVIDEIVQQARDSIRKRWQPVLRPEWRTATALGIARAIHADAAFDRLPILADALQDAGCEHDDILGHLREGGRHAKCCWVVELLLEEPQG